MDAGIAETMPPLPAAYAEQGVAPRERLDDSLAMRYARAVQEGDCETIERLTWWVRERLERVGAEANGAASIDGERERLCGQLLDRPLEKNALRRQGIEDACLFRPGARLDAIGRDAGRQDLDKPVAYRAWIWITYPDAAQAPCDERSRPIRSLKAGVNVSVDGYVLKANVIGNVDIDRDSFSYDWPTVKGG